MARTSAQDVLDAVLDPRSWLPWDLPVADPPADVAYRDDLARARAATGLDEAVLAGEGTVAGRRVAVVVGEFDFLGGSIGVAAAWRLVAAVERATRERLPLLASPTSGGTRMQEGTPAFVQMVAITAAVAEHRRAGLPYLVHLRHPTTGGVLASWGSLGHVTSAEPGATIGFAGPRVVEALTGCAMAAGVQTAEHLRDHGVIDAVVPTTELGAVAARVLAVLAPCPGPSAPADPSGTVSDVDLDALLAEPAWDVVVASRRPGRPGVADLLRLGATDVTRLSGTGEGEYEPSLVLALARFGGMPAVVLGHDRRRQSGEHALGPAGLRTARRGMRLAVELGIPLVSIVDTGGAALSAEAEEGGLAGEIARSLADLVELEAPTLCVLLGQGAGGAALALVPADRVVAAAHAWLSPLPPEGSAVVVHRDAARAPELAASQQIRAVDLLRSGVVDRVVAERPDAADEPEAFVARVARVVAEELAGLAAADPADRAAARRRRFAAVPEAGR
jgi:acetyl-CoA carboxylase carboxyl transferase subunit beta